MAKTYMTYTEIREAFIKQGWNPGISFSEYTLEDAVAEGRTGVADKIRRGQRFYRMNNNGNVYDDRGSLECFDIKPLAHPVAIPMYSHSTWKPARAC